MHDLDIVCTCMSVSVADIKLVIQAGATTFNEIQEKTGVGTVCGACAEEVEDIVNKLLDDNKLNK